MQMQKYLVKAQEAANFFDNTGRKEGIKQFIFEKLINQVLVCL